MNPAVPPYGETVAATNFSFLRGASHPQEMVLAALSLGQSGIGIADRNTVAGVVRAYSTLEIVKEHGLPPPEKIRHGSSPGEYTVVSDRAAEEDEAARAEFRRRARTFRLAVGTRLVFTDDAPEIAVYPTDRAAWGRICRLLTLGARRAKKGSCLLRLDDLLTDPRGLLLVVLPSHRIPDGLGETLGRIAEAATGAVWLGAAMHRRGDDHRRLARLGTLARAADVPLLAINDALYAEPTARDLQDILTCIREHVTIEQAGRRLEANAERHLKPPAEMARLFRNAPEAIAETQHLLSRVGFSLGELGYDYPEETRSRK